MRVGILLTDHVRDSMRELAGGDFDVIYTRFLHRGDTTIETVVYDVINGELPESPAACDAWIITGSHYDAFASDPWIEALKEFIRSIHATRSRLVGVCFGHQVIAEALGGRVERAAELKIGPQPMDVAAQPWFDGGQVAVNACHRDVVTVLPGDAEPIATGTTGVYPAYRIGNHILSIQDHPEYDAEYTRELLTYYTEELGPDEIAEVERRIDQVPTDNPVVTDWIVRFLGDHRTRPAQVESVQVGRAEPLEFDGRVESTGIRKKPTSEITITRDGVVGDAVVNTTHHGGADQAVYVYTSEDYRWWERALGRVLAPGLFGENLTITSQDGVARVGDRLVIGDVVLEVTAPRVPCGKFRAVMGEHDWKNRFNDARRPGYYCRVIVEGTVRPTDSVEWRPAPSTNVAVVELLNIHLEKDADETRIQRALGSPIADRFRRSLEERLARMKG